MYRVPTAPPGQMNPASTMPAPAVQASPAPASSTSALPARGPTGHLTFIHMMNALAATVGTRKKKQVNPSFLVGKSLEGEMIARALAYDLFTHATVGLGMQHIENSFVANLLYMPEVRWIPVTTCLADMCRVQQVQLLPSDWALNMPGELVRRGFDIMRFFLVSENMPHLVGLVEWLRICAGSELASVLVVHLSTYKNTFVGWCGEIWKDALHTWRHEWQGVPSGMAAQRLEPLLLAHPRFIFMREAVKKLAGLIDGILQCVGDHLECGHLDPWYKVMTTMVVPSRMQQAFVLMSEYNYPLRGPLMEKPFRWSVKKGPWARIPENDRPVSAVTAGFPNSEETGIVLNPSLVITLANRCHLSLATILPYEDGHFSFGNSSAVGSPGTVVRIRLRVGLYVELPAVLVRDVATVKMGEVIEAVRHGGGEVRADPNGAGSRFKVILHQPVNRFAQKVGGTTQFAREMLSFVTSQPQQQQCEVRFGMLLLVNPWGSFNALFVDDSPVVPTWPIVTEQTSLLQRDTVVGSVIPAGNLWTGNSPWQDPIQSPPNGASKTKRAALMVLETASLLNLAGLLWLAFTSNLDALVYVVVGANAIGEFSSRLLACAISKRRALHYLGAWLSPVTWAVFEEGVQEPLRGRRARGIVVLEALPGVVGLGAALVGVGFEEVWSQVVIGIVAVASFFGGWGVSDFVQEIRGKCECRYDPEKMLLQAAMLYMTALIVEVAVLGPLFADDVAALITAIFGVVEALVATFAVHRFVKASERLRAAMGTRTSVTLPPPLPVRVGNLITGQGMTLAPTHHVSHCEPISYGNGRGVEEQREVVMGIGSNGMLVEVALNDVLGVVSPGQLSHVGSYKQKVDGRLIETHISVLHWHGAPPDPADLRPVGEILLIFCRFAQGEPSFDVFATRNVNLELTCCQTPLPSTQNQAPVRQIKAVAVSLPEGVVLPFGANMHNKVQGFAKDPDVCRRANQG